MKYFTPKLYRQGNIESSEVYDDFDRIWDEKIREYRKYLRSIKSQTPQEVMRLASALCLHDGEIVGITKSSVTVWLNEVLYSVEFDLDLDSPQPKHLPAISGHPFDKSGHCWLYDELELIGPGLFQFEILLSNGRILRFRFRNVIIWEVASKNPSNGHRQASCPDASHPKLTLSKLQQLVFSPNAKVSRGASTKSTRDRSGTAKRKAARKPVSTNRRVEKK